MTTPNLLRDVMMQMQNLKLSSPLRSNQNNEDKENTPAGQGIPSKSRTEDENNRNFSSSETTFQNCCSNSSIQTDGKVNSAEKDLSNTLDERPLKQSSSLFEEQNSGSDFISPDENHNPFFLEEAETVVANKKKNNDFGVQHSVNRKNDGDSSSDIKSKNPDLNSTYSFNGGVTDETFNQFETTLQESSDSLINTTSTVTCSETKSVLLQSDSFIIDSDLETKAVKLSCKKDASIDEKGTCQELKLSVSHNESRGTTNEFVTADLTNEDIEKSPIVNPVPISCEFVEEKSHTPPTKKVDLEFYEESNRNLSGESKFLESGENHITGSICTLNCEKIIDDKVPIQNQVNYQADEKYTEEHSSSKFPEKFEGDNSVELYTNSSLVSPEKLDKTYENLNITKIVTDSGDIPNPDDINPCGVHIENLDNSNILATDQENLSASLAELSCVDLSTINSSSGDIDKTTIILISDDSNTSTDSQRDFVSPTDQGESELVIPSTVKLLDKSSYDVCVVNSGISIKVLETDEYTIGNDKQPSCTDIDLKIPKFQEEVNSITVLEGVVPENNIEGELDIKYDNVILGKDKQEADINSTKPLKTQFSVKEMEMTNEKFQQEISDLKLELNASKQTISSLELEIAKKDEIILKIQAESMKKEQQFQQDLKLLKEQMKEKSNLEGKDPIKELEEALKEAKIKENQATSELNARINDELNYRKIMEEYEKSIATCVADSQKVKEENETLTRHLANLELSFSDLHQKYERTKIIIDGFKNNEDKLRKKFALFEETFHKQDEKYESLKAHAKAQIEKSNKENIQLREKNDSEIIKLNAIVKRLEIKSAALETSLEQKTKECVALAALCDEVTGKKV